MSAKRTTGSVHKRGARWSIVISNFRDPQTGEYKTQKWFSHGHKRKRDAEDKLREILEELSNSTFVVESTQELGEYADHWLRISKPKYAYNTWRRWNGIVQNHLKPMLGNIPLSELNPEKIEAYYDAKRREGKQSETSLAQHHTVLSRILKSALKKRKIRENPLPLIDNRPDEQVREMSTWNQDQARKALKTASEFGLQAETLYTLLLESGMRLGEVAGLRWPDLTIGKDKTVVKIQRTLVKPGPEPRFGPCKWHSQRKVTVGPQLTRLLRQHRKSQNELKLIQGERYHQHNLVFAKETGPFPGCPIQTNNLGQRLHDKIIEKAEVPRIRIHDLRHTSATLALERGIHPKVVSTRLGHRSIRITMDLYSHVTDSIEEQAAEIMADILGQASSQHL